MVNINLDIVFEIIFFILNDKNINFLKKKFDKDFKLLIKFYFYYQINWAIEKKEYIITAFDLRYKIFVYIAFLLALIIVKLIKFILFIKHR